MKGIKSVEQVTSAHTAFLSDGLLIALLRMHRIIVAVVLVAIVCVCVSCLIEDINTRLRERARALFNIVLRSSFHIYTHKQKLEESTMEAFRPDVLLRKATKVCSPLFVCLFSLRPVPFFSLFFSFLSSFLLPCFFAFVRSFSCVYAKIYILGVLRMRRAIYLSFCFCSSLLSVSLSCPLLHPII